MTRATQSLWSGSGRSHQVMWLTVGCLEAFPANKGSLAGAPTLPSFQGLGIQTPYRWGWGPGGHAGAHQPSCPEE